MTLVPPATESALGAFVDALVEKRRILSESGLPVRVAWLNHYSIRLAVDDAPEALAEMDVCGVDGQLLKWLLRHPVRTSADLVVPVLLRCDDTIRTVLAIGGPGDRAAALSEAFSGLAERPVAVHCIDGFDGLLRGDALRRAVTEVQPDLLLVGLGAGLQEQVLVEASTAMARGYALTCGGFLDQVLQTGYYPDWAYPLRLNWLVRLVREPRRLWRRYTVQAFSALLRARVWRRFMLGVPGLVMHAQMCLLDGATRDRA
ncbi:UDP-N-acetyl-D-mannosaminuronic acid transferase (WecB/TagA/CpsF family) [Blastococcus colisei]|uniref:UDP-N-acetyl-D-mannosaminuronic acid transferase (WecB/TagA/CpsF family) n=1 Tax=Blastococcus colisei TaxID=1564162 RepID=A0A543P0Q8_9ACTN|nr:WecB/TagA/CpsF family glycosyltransferase [Blastococcus colisei]TQN37560.1 UDP-N-acetyl-D-mannosaminuronic acid transferase (WecB/TagA/CpsF family) [Blastococcus colisei]